MQFCPNALQTRQTSRWLSGTSTSTHIVVVSQAFLQYGWGSPDLKKTWFCSHFLKKTAAPVGINTLNFFCYRWLLHKFWVIYYYDNYLKYEWAIPGLVSIFINQTRQFIEQIKVKNIHLSCTWWDSNWIMSFVCESQPLIQSRLTNSGCPHNQAPLAICQF